MKKITTLIIVLILQFSLVPGFKNQINVCFASDDKENYKYSAENKLNIYQFGDNSCYYCQNEKTFLLDIGKKYSNIKINYLDAIDKDSKLLSQVALKLGVRVGGVPFLVIGNEYIFGYQDEKTTGLEIESRILSCLKNFCTDLVMQTQENINGLNLGGRVKKIMAITNKEMAKRLKGQIILKVESSGEAYYVNPETLNMYYLGHPNDAFEIMQQQGIGISNNDLEKIPVALANFEGFDYDGDGLSDVFEDAIGFDSRNKDSSSDGISDKEIFFKENKLNEQALNKSFINKQLGKIFLSVERKGEAWYVNPSNGKRYFLGNPNDAFLVMKNLGLGISNLDFTNLDK